MHEIDRIYSEYCKRHEDAVIKLQELETQPEGQQFLAASIFNDDEIERSKTIQLGMQRTTSRKDDKLGFGQSFD